ncbi:hypothetical protein PIROE2DRAFT_2785 [Piromyces sp. E2]|nr:hypothetical protein PIROE2DRAFT_2785 [Piromyces sp. E2]|eukprot:OUM69288.1 hypothetical protein PIROE2DRAFT_2785 [Piromyces sp. E2]
MESICFLIILLLTIIGVNAIDITLHGFIYADMDPLYQNLEQRVNNHFKQIGKDIRLQASFGSYQNSSLEPAKIAESLDDLIPKKNNKYKGVDLYITDTVYTGRFAKHFEDLYERLPEDVLKHYKDGTATKTCIMNGRLAGLPYHIDYQVIFANQDLLDKYHFEFPKTWEELIKVENFIHEKENDPQLHRYMGHFDQYENGPIGFLEFVHSFRESPTDNFPSYTSENAIKALEQMKKVKQLASNDDDFSADDTSISPVVLCTKFVFIKQFYLPPEVYDAWRQDPQVQEMCKGVNIAKIKAYHLPGKKAGISASGIGGNNISMSRYISEEKKEAATEILKFIFSYEEQKFNAANYGIKTGIHALYKEPEVCAKLDCEFFSSMQGIVRPSSETINYSKYIDTVRKLVYEYIYEKTDKNAKEVLIEIDDIRRIHFIEAQSVTGIIILGFTLLTAILIFSAYIYVSIKRFRNQFVFLSFNYWCLIILGIFTMACYCLTGIQKLSNFNCIIRPILLSFGFSMLYIPILLKMLSIFPSKNGLTKFVKDHFGFVFILFILIDVALNAAWYHFDRYTIDNIIVESGKNFQTCSSMGTFGNIMQYSLYGYKILILLIMCVLVFAEWNLAAFRSDIRTVTITLYTNLLLIGMFIIVGKIKIENRYLHFGLKAALVLIFCLSTLIIIIGSKVYQVSFSKNEAYPDISSFKNSSNGGMSSSRYYSELNPSQISNKNMLLNYHFHTGDGTMRPNPTLFSSTFNSSYNGNLFSNSSHSSSRNDSQSQSINDYNSRNFSNNNFSGNSYSNNNYSNNNYNFSNNAYNFNNNIGKNYKMY